MLPPIAKDVTMVAVVTKDQFVHHAQHLDFIYSQLHTLYNLILTTPQPPIDGSHSNPRTHVNGVVGSTSSSTVG